MSNWRSSGWWLMLGMLGGGVACSWPVMAESVSTLDTLLVTAQGYAASARETPQALDVLEPEVAAGAVVGDLLQRRPGMAVHADGAWGKNPVLRGLKKESLVVLVDGVRLNSAQPQGAIASLVDLGLLERVEVVRGPSSVLYGSGAMGGVVHLMTPDPELSADPQLSGRFRTSLSSADEGLAGALRMQASSPDHAVLAGVAGRQAQAYRTPDGEQAHTGFSSGSALFKTRHRLTDNLQLRVNLQHQNDTDVWYPGSARTGGQPGGAGIPPLLGTVTIHSPQQQRTLYGLGVDLADGAGTTQLDVSRQDVFRQIRAFSDRLGRDYVRNDVHFVTDALRMQHSRALDDVHRLTFGADGWIMTGEPERYIDNNPPLFNSNQRNDPFQKGRIEAAGVFVQDDIHLDRWRFQVGARWDQVRGEARQKGAGPAAQTDGLTHADSNLSWSLAALYALTPDLNAYVNVSQAYRAADMRERFEDSARGDGYYHVGNPQLSPEQARAVELGIKGRSATTQYTLAVFAMRIDDFIAGRVTGQQHPGTGLPLKSTENLDEVSIRGVEGALDLALGSYQLDSGFTLLRGDNDQDGEPLYQMPAAEAVLGIGHPAEHGLYWRTGLRAVAEQDRVAARFSGGGEDATPGYVTVDARAGWHFGQAAGLAALTLDVQANNLLDKTYHDHLTDGIAGREPLAPGRNLVVALTGQF